MVLNNTDDNARDAETEKEIWVLILGVNAVNPSEPVKTYQKTYELDFH